MINSDHLDEYHFARNYKKKKHKNQILSNLVAGVLKYHDLSGANQN